MKTRTAADELPVDACEAAVAWCKTQPDLAIAWETCERGDWLLWLAGRKRVSRKILVLAACDCAETAPIHTYIPEAVEALRVARAWAAREATLEEVREAANAANAAASAYAADSVADYAAASAASAAAAYVAADYATASAAASVAAAYTDYASLKRSAELVRARIPFSELQP